ncbi:cyclophilin-like domain-containing protein [Catenaria anguillulae PL171]|uniref:Peptidyl-prolyl cis-trans isomerase n=1 Tax=Catenaria anguillulae PL171 TaxID=765915 RepID=A0A1Y2HU30_9FUNG|nr:cyclophilin-like domain-containing protein [Catenaria anguillulae PL171]
MNTGNAIQAPKATMSILFETSLGDIVIDLYTDASPLACTNLLKLCKLKYFNFHLFFNVQRDLLIQSGDPTGTGKGGCSAWHLVDPSAAPQYFLADPNPRRNKHDRKGLVSLAMASVDPVSGRGVAGSQFFITTTDKAGYLDGKACIVGEVAEGMDVVDRINAVFTDEQGRPLQDVRIKHTIILDDPTPDPPGLREPSRSPSPPPDVLDRVRLADDESLDDPNLDPVAAEQRKRAQEAASRALALEMMGDLPFAEIKPPENVLFVCKLNPVTRDEDLELIFSRFGTVHSCEVIRDKATGESLCYAFIEFDDREACEAAYFKMDNVLIDDRRIKVDFSQSVSKLHKEWMEGRRRGATGGVGGFANLQKRTQYRVEGEQAEDAHVEGIEKAALVFEHDADLRAGRDVDARTHETEEVPFARDPSEAGASRGAYAPSGSASGSRSRHREDRYLRDERGFGRRDVDREHERERERSGRSRYEEELERSSRRRENGGSGRYNTSRRG